MKVWVIKIFPKQLKINSRKRPLMGIPNEGWMVTNYSSKYSSDLLGTGSNGLFEPI
jgi:hypothetical protein